MSGDIVAKVCIGWNKANKKDGVVVEQEAARKHADVVVTKSGTDGIEKSIKEC